MASRMRVTSLMDEARCYPALPIKAKTIGHRNEEGTLDWLAREVGVSKFHFCRLFKKTTGLTPSRYFTSEVHRAIPPFTGLRSCILALCFFPMTVFIDGTGISHARLRAESSSGRHKSPGLQYHALERGARCR